jgi:hypothetical protein
MMFVYLAALVCSTTFVCLGVVIDSGYTVSDRREDSSQLQRLPQRQREPDCQDPYYRNADGNERPVSHSDECHTCSGNADNRRCEQNQDTEGEDGRWISITQVGVDLVEW